MIRIKVMARQLISNLRINLVSEKVLGEAFLVVIFSSCMLQHIFKRKAPLFLTEIISVIRKSPVEYPDGIINNTGFPLARE
jgi:hypothetical protein